MIWPVLSSLETFLEQEMAVVWMAIMMWVAEAEGWCWWDLWTPWPPSPGNLQEAKAYLHVLGQQRSLSTMSALCHTKCRVLLWSRLELLPERKLVCKLIEWHACGLLVLQFNHCMCQGHTGCTAGGDGLLSWRVQHECTGTRGHDAYSQVWEEETLEQEKKQRKVRNRRRKGGEEQAVDEEGTTYKAGAFSTTFCKYF